MGSGCGDSIVEKSFVLRANSPSRWHLTRRLLLCSGVTIHQEKEIVNINCKIMEMNIDIRVSKQILNGIEAVAHLFPFGQQFV